MISSPGAQEGLQHRVLRGQPRSKRGRERHAFQFREHRLEPLTRGIVRARIGKALVLARRLLFVSRSLENRSDQRTCLGLRRLTCMNRSRCEFHCLSPFVPARARAIQIWPGSRVRSSRLTAVRQAAIEKHGSRAWRRPGLVCNTVWELNLQSIPKVRDQLRILSLHHLPSSLHQRLGSPFMGRN